MTHALRQIADAMIGVLTPALGDTQLFFDRSTSEALTDDEMPGVVIRLVEFDIEYVTGVDLHRWSGAVDFDIYTNSQSLEAISDAHMRISAEIVSAIASDPTLGGRVLIFEPRSITTSEDSIPDVGVCVLTFSLVFETRGYDWNTIIGPGGTFV